MKNRNGWSVFLLAGSVGISVILTSACESETLDRSRATQSAEAAEGTRASAADPGAVGHAIERALQQPGRLDRIQQLSTILADLDADGFEQARKVFERESFWFEPVEKELFIEAWTRFDPVAAVEAATSQSGATRYSGQLPAAILGWALRDPEAAAIKAEELIKAQPRDSRKIMTGLLMGWAQSGKPGVLEYAASLPEERSAFRVALIAAQEVRWLRTPAVLDWVDGVRDIDLPEDFRRDLFRSVASMAARQDPEAVARWSETHLGQPYADQVARVVIERWLPIDASAAFRWASELGSTKMPPATLQRAFSLWLDEDRAQAMSWIEAAPRERPYDAAFAAYASHLAKSAPTAALDWAERVQDESLRLVSLEEVALHWHRIAPEAAERWLDDSPLSADARLRVRQSPKGQERDLLKRVGQARRRTP